MLFITILILLFTDSISCTRFENNIKPISNVDHDFLIQSDCDKMTLSVTNSYDPDNGPFKLQYRWEYIQGYAENEIIVLLEPIEKLEKLVNKKWGYLKLSHLLENINTYCNKSLVVVMTRQLSNT